MHDISSAQKIANKLAEDLGVVLRKNKLTIVTAESCTGGLVSSVITEVPGSSHWFLQGWVTYSNKAKIKELNIPSELINKHGAVSFEVVEQMAIGALKKSGADISIATSGIAGPDGGTVLKPVGTVFIAVAIKNKQVVSSLLSLCGTRKEIRELTVKFVLEKVLEILD